MNWKIRIKNPVFWVQIALGAFATAAGLRRSDRCGHDHLGGCVADHQGNGCQSVLPVSDRVQRVERLERPDHQRFDGLGSR